MNVEIDADGRLEADVAIVGAGLAGLMAARVVAAAGLKPVVLEARERVGGRAEDKQLDGDVVLELGAQFVPAQDTRHRALLAELGIELAPGL